MPSAPQRRQGTLEQPGRLAAIGGAAVVCALTVSGALGIVPTGSDGSSQHDAARQTPSGTSNGAAQTSAHQPMTDPGRPAQGGQPTAPDAAAPAPAPSPATSPALPADSGTGSRVVFDMAEQRVWLVDGHGTVERSYAVSGSKYDNLNAGTYEVYSRDADATAYNSNETMRYMVRFAYGRSAPIGFHSIPALPNGKLVEQRSGLGAPQSDGCIRQWLSDARAMWEFAAVGTKVVVLA